MECFVIVLLLWVFSVCLHEYGHAKVAQLGGDYTVEEKGYLTMNPMYYAHPVLSFVIPIFFLMLGAIGLPGGAVYINHQLLRSKQWDTAVSLAGPAMNLLLAVILSMLLRFYFVPQYPTHIVTYSLAFVAQLQISAMLFNLIPMPGLDGFGAIAPWLPPAAEETVSALRVYGIWILFGLFRMVPGLNLFFWTLVWRLTEIMGVDPELGFHGMQSFRFWLG